MNLQTIVDICEIAASLTVVGGSVFALLQLKDFRQWRREAVAGELMRATMSPEFIAAQSIILRLDDGVSAEVLRREGIETERAAVAICLTYESIGLLVYEQVMPFPLFLELLGGNVVLLWRKLGPWVTKFRADQSCPSESEWFQWLAEQCEQRKAAKVPAYLRHRDWEP